MMYVFHVKTQKKVVIEVAITVNALGEVIQAQMPDGSNGWGHLGDLIRAGYVDRAGARGGEEVYQVRKDVSPTKTRRV